MLNLWKREENPFARMRRLLHEMPWLWGIKLTWMHDAKIYFERAHPGQHLTFSNEPHASFFVHLESTDRETLVRLKMQKRNSKLFQLEDVLAELRARRISLEHVAHIVVRSGDRVTVTRMPMDKTLEEIALVQGV